MHFFSSLLRMERYPFRHSYSKGFAGVFSTAWPLTPTWPKHTAHPASQSSRKSNTSGQTPTFMTVPLETVLFLKKMLTAKNTLTFHNDHQRDIYNSLAHILLCVWYTAQLDTSASPRSWSPIVLRLHWLVRDLSSLGHAWSSTWTSQGTRASVLLASCRPGILSGLSWTRALAAPSPILTEEVSFIC